MIPIKVNIDYEAVLFFDKKGKDAINYAIEFLALFVEERPLHSTKKYPPEYLDYIKSLIKRVPQIVSSGPYENWWGELRNIELEKKMNSKLTSTELTISRKWCEETFIAYSIDEIKSHSLSTRNIAKNPFGMSGQNFYIFPNENLSSNDEKCINHLLKSGPVIIEPFFDRRFDFSHYCFSSNHLIGYENLIDSHFQYKGSVFNQIQSPQKESFSFFKLISHAEWDKFDNALSEIIKFYRGFDFPGGFSIDSFVYHDQGEFKIRVLSEINFRRTMGQVAYELALKFNSLLQFGMLILARQKEDQLSFLNLKSKLDSLLYKKSGDSGVVILSPGDTRYEMFFLVAENRTESLKLFTQLKKLLPNTEFAVEI